MTFSSTAPAHPHATRVAVYPALLVTCRRLYDPLCVSVHWSVGRSVGQFPLVFLALTGGFCITTLTQMIGLAFYVTATAQPHATSVAVYTALFSFKGHPPEPER